MRIDFTSKDTAEYWTAVNDGVMGGRSSGGPTFDNDYMRFDGTINTNGGGFSSIRALMGRGALANTEGVKIKVRTDGRAYKLSLRTGQTFRGRSIAFQAPLPVTDTNSWQEVFIPYSDLKGSIFGRPVSGVTFRKSDAQQIGFIIADGKDGPFRLDVEWIEAC